MGFRFRKSIQLVPGVRMTFSTAGVSRAPVIRHQALLERARSYLAEGRTASARRDLERIRAENAAHPGMAEALAAAGASPGP